MGMDESGWTPARERTCPTCGAVVGVTHIGMGSGVPGGFVAISEVCGHELPLLTGPA